MITTSDWKCASCGLLLEQDAPGAPCPACGKIGRLMGMTIQESVSVLSAMRAVKTDPTRPGKKRRRIDLFQGWQVRRSVGDMVKKLRRVDRDADTYDETVEDADGNILHECHEALSDHFGHGTAKQGSKT